MQLTAHSIDSTSITLIALDGRLDIMGTNEIELKFNSHAAGSTGPVIVDLSKVTFMSSIGLRLLLANAQTLRRKGHQMVLFAAEPLIADVLTTSGISNALQVVKTKEEALQASKIPVA